MELDIPVVLKAVLENYALPLDGHHGVGHWARVLENGLRLAEETGANIEVVQLFRTKPDDDYDRKLLHDVKEHGWHLVGIDDDEEGPAYVFSVGMFHTLGHPEICMFGLIRTETMGQIINDIGDLIMSGHRFDDWEESDDVLDGYSCMFRTVDVVCAGDSLTGWNNYGPSQYWPFPTYPRFLQKKCEPLGLQIADGGIAGEISDNGPGHVRRYLELSPDSRYFIIGFGTNDLGTWPDLERTSQRIIKNLDIMVQAVWSANEKPIMFNVPNVNEAMFPPPLVADCRQKRDYHNDKLSTYCAQNELPLADIRSHLHDRHIGDSLHPNEAGAKVIADVVFEVLSEVHIGSK